MYAGSNWGGGKVSQEQLLARQAYADEYHFLLAQLREEQSQPSASELLDLLEAEAKHQRTWNPKSDFWALVDRLRSDSANPKYLRRYFNEVLTDDEVAVALFSDNQQLSRERSSLDELFQRSQALRSSESFRELIRFTAKFREYKPFNNMLVRLQRPGATHFATANDWHAKFGRSIKEDAIPILILAPMTPLICVYDIEDTDGRPVPKLVDDFAKVDGRLDPKKLEAVLRNCERKLIEVAFKPLGKLSGGFATTKVSNSKFKMRIVVNERYSIEQRFSVLCHEIAHILLGHLGGDKDGWWPTRINLSHRSVEIEAESVAFIVCNRAGLHSTAENYLAMHNPEPSQLAKVSVDLIVRVAGQIESMGERLLPLDKVRKKKGKNGEDQIAYVPPQQLLFFTERDIPISEDFDEIVYEQARSHFDATWNAFRANEKDLKCLFQFLVENLGIRVKPYAVRFAKEISLGETSINLSH